MKKYKVLNAISAVALIVGFGLLIGTTGSWERNNITGAQALIQYGITAAVMLVGLLIQAYLDVKYRK